MDNDDDERQIELDCIAAIFPEISIEPGESFAASLDLPVQPRTPVVVKFLSSITTTDDASTANKDSVISTTSKSENEHHLCKTRHISYLPSLHLRLNLPQGYPISSPPEFTISTSIPWLPVACIHALEKKGRELWDDMEHSSMLYDYIDWLQQAAETAFGYAAEDGLGNLELLSDHEIALLDFSIKATQAAFDRETFACGVCLGTLSAYFSRSMNIDVTADPKKGSACHKMLDCGHVFCVECLQDFYNVAIKEGNLASVRCLAPNCAKVRLGDEDLQTEGLGQRSKLQLSPSELLQIPLEKTIVQRYVTLKHKSDLESDKSTIYCPRPWCQGAARSKHRKPDVEIHTESLPHNSKPRSNEQAATKESQEADDFSRADLLAICEDCELAFCSRCFGVWHGEFTICFPRLSSGELTAEDQASLEYMRLYSTPCPTCDAPAQKTHGCNHMICFRCNTHFCYLCSAWLEPSNPYRHYNEGRTGCFQRLWELEEGEGQDVAVAEEVDAAQMNVRQNQARAIQGRRQTQVLDRRPRPERIPPDGQQRPIPNIDLPAVELEAPLVLRINQVQAPRPAAAAPAAVARAGEGAHGPRHRGNNRQRNADQPNVRRGPPRARDHDHGFVGPQDGIAANLDQQAWVQQFVQMALRDEEHLIGWDSDDDDDLGGLWEIPVA